MTYTERLEHFRQVFEQQHNERLSKLYKDAEFEPVGVETGGYKFDRVFIVRAGQKVGRFMVAKPRDGQAKDAETIYGIRTWVQHNPRRQYGTLSTVDQYEWGAEPPVPIPGTEADREHVAREQAFKAAHKKQGRKNRMTKIAALVHSLSANNELWSKAEAASKTKKESKP